MNNFNDFETFLASVDSDLKKIFDYQSEYLCCKEGCSLCCERGDFPISELEFNYLMQDYEKLNDSLKKQIKENIRIIKESGNLDSYTCPFLINKKCTLYEKRPFVCRAFGVLTEDANGNPSFPFCTTQGLNFSQIYDSEKQRLSSDLVHQKNFKIFPKVFRLSNRNIMNLPLAKELNLNFGKLGRLIDFL